MINTSRVHATSGLAASAALRGLSRWALPLMAAGVGAVHGFEFGVRLGGPLLGVALAANAALMGGLVVDGLLDRARALWTALRR